MGIPRRPLAPKERGSVSVLVIDDDPDVRDVMAALLEMFGYTAASAANGREALLVLESVEPELIFLDLEMPIMDGASFRQVQRRDRSLLEIPTVVMTGARAEAFLDPAITQTLRKPARVDDLLAIVRTHCELPTH